MKDELKFLQSKDEKSIDNDGIFSERTNNIPISFLREILKLASQKNIISFAGGVPNPDYFPIEKLKEAALEVFNNDAQSALQYSITEGYYPLRKYISERYKTTQGIDIKPEEILITNGSQQGLDLIGKIFLDKHDKVLLEKPSYLGAIQAFSAYEPEFFNADLREDGIDVDQVEDILWENNIKLFYTVPNFQNPTGISYSSEKRKALTDIIKYHQTIIVEDNPYGDIRFEGTQPPSFKSFLPEQTILLGSFSKIIAPGIRIGWIASNETIMKKLVVAKQATDLHSNFLCQKIISNYLENNNLNEHIEKISFGYKKQTDLMIDLIENYFSPHIKYTKPSGGLFIWLTLPKYCDAYLILQRALEEGIAFVPGNTFFQDNKGANTIRLSFSNQNEEEMKHGMLKLSKILNSFIKNNTE